MVQEIGNGGLQYWMLLTDKTVGNLLSPVPNNWAHPTLEIQKAEESCLCSHVDKRLNESGMLYIWNAAHLVMPGRPHAFYSISYLSLYYHIFVFRICTLLHLWPWLALSVKTSNYLIKLIIPHHWGGQMQETQWKVALLASTRWRIPASPTGIGKLPPPGFCFLKLSPEPSGPLGKCTLLRAESSSGYPPQNSAASTARGLCLFPQRVLKTVSFARLVFKIEWNF